MEAQAAAMLDDATPGPGGLPSTSSLRSRRSPLADPETQIATLDALDLEDEPFAGDFAAAVLGVDPAGLRAGEIEIFQTNLGRL